MRTLFPLIPLVMCAACAVDVDGETTASGAATYDDAETTREGEPAEPASPEPGTRIDVTLEVDATGDFGVSDPACSLDGASGAVEGLYRGDGRIEDDGVYVASFASSDARFETPSGCDVPDVELSVVSGVDVVAVIENTSEQCETYCEAKARSYAEGECSGDLMEATCRADTEAEYAGSCETTCSDPQTRGIVARTSLGADAVAGLVAGSLTGVALGEIEADLTFDHLEDEDGNEVQEYDGPQ